MSDIFFTCVPLISLNDKVLYILFVNVIMRQKSYPPYDPNISLS